ncbi:MAG: ATP-binding protein [Streptomyces sp.]|uniref:ATP-binding protein n=1 Tax=Streptomyces sp. TaxID=1931 RepID=UPI003D6BC632
MTDTPVALIVFLALGTVAAVALALLLARSRREAHRLRSRFAAAETDLGNASRHSADLGARLQAAEAELSHLAGARIPDLAASLAHPNVAVRGPLGAGTPSPVLDRSLEAVLTQVSEAIGKERLRVDSAAQAALRGSTTTIQALLYQLQTLLQRMQEKYDDPLVAEDLLAADFLNEQALRRIQSTAVVCGAWPGLTRDNSHLADIVVGAMSRLNGYERIQVTNQLRDPVGVIARAAEPVAVTLTELMANALHYSHPDLPVAVTLQQGNRGASVIIDDAGVGMHADELTRAKRLMSGEEPVLITELGDPPRNGLAAIGRLVRQYGFSTHVEASPYGGVRAVVHIPGEPLLTLLDETDQPMSAMAPLPTAGARTLPGRAGTDSRLLAPSDAGSDVPVPGAEEELPRRSRRRPTAEQEQPADADGDAESWVAEGPRTEAGAAPAASPEESAERWSAFQQGTASGRAAVGSGRAVDSGRAEAAADTGIEASSATSADNVEQEHGDHALHADHADHERADPPASEGNPPA